MAKLKLVSGQRGRVVSRNKVASINTPSGAALVNPEQLIVFLLCSFRGLSAYEFFWNPWRQSFLFFTFGSAVSSSSSYFPYPPTPIAASLTASIVGSCHLPMPRPSPVSGRRPRPPGTGVQTVPGATVISLHLRKVPYASRSDTFLWRFFDSPYRWSLWIRQTRGATSLLVHDRGRRTLTFRVRQGVRFLLSGGEIRLSTIIFHSLLEMRLRTILWIRWAAGQMHWEQSLLRRPGDGGDHRRVPWRTVPRGIRALRHERYRVWSHGPAWAVRPVARRRRAGRSVHAVGLWTSILLEFVVGNSTAKT